MRKERHWILTTTLIIIGLANILLATSYILLGANEQPDSPIASSHLPWLSLISILNIFWVYLVFNWKKIGLWGFIFTAIAKFVVNYTNGTRFPELLFNFIGITLIVIVLQVKKKSVSEWSNLN